MVTATHWRFFRPRLFTQQNGQASFLSLSLSSLFPCLWSLLTVRVSLHFSHQERTVRIQEVQKSRQCAAILHWRRFADGMGTFTRKVSFIAHWKNGRQWAPVSLSKDCNSSLRMSIWIHKRWWDYFHDFYLKLLCTKEKQQQAMCLLRKNTARLFHSFCLIQDLYMKDKTALQGNSEVTDQWDL